MPWGWGTPVHGLRKQLHHSNDFIPPCCARISTSRKSTRVFRPAGRLCGLRPTLTCGKRHLTESRKQSAHIHRNFVFVEPINGHQWKTRRMRHPQLFSNSYGVCTEEREDQSESKEERQCQHQSKSSTDRQCSFGRKRVGQRLSKVQPRALCVPDRRRTDLTLSRMGPHWNAVYID